MFHVAISISFLIFDRFLVEILRLIRGNSTMEFEQSGEYNVDVVVNGRGPLAKYLKALLVQFDDENYVTTFLDNTMCLPNANEMEAK